MGKKMTKTKELTVPEVIDAAVEAFKHTKHPNLALGSYLTGKDISEDRKTNKVISQVVTNLKRKAAMSEKIPAEFAPKLAALSGVRPCLIRPDVFREQWAVARVYPSKGEQ